MTQSKKVLLRSRVTRPQLLRDDQNPSRRVQFAADILGGLRNEMSTKKVQLVALIILCFALSSLVHGQANGSLSGTVADKTGGVITGASVKITSQATGLQRDAKTDDSGHYLVPLLPVSIYTIHVEAQGFQTIEQKDIR